MGFLEQVSDETFEVKRIVKARIGPNELESIKERLLSYAKSSSNGEA
jgi:hypothetical protein